MADEKYTELFENALTSDGAYSEGLFSELSNRFLKELEYFVEQLSILNDEDRKIISFNIVHIMHMNELKLNKKFKDALYDIKYRKKDIELNKNNALAIDLGIDDLCTCTTNLGDSFIIDGKKLKSINQWANKENSKLQSIKDRRGIKETMVYTYTK